MTDYFCPKHDEGANDTNNADYNLFVACGKSVIKKIICRSWIAVFTLVGALLPELVSTSPVSAMNQHERDSVDFLQKANWETSYEEAIQKARSEKKNLLIYFRAEKDSSELQNTTEERFVSSGRSRDDQAIRQVAYISPSLQRPLPLAESCRKFEQEVLSDLEVLAALDRFILLCLPIDAETKDADGKMQRLMDSQTFRDMERYPGLAILDFEHDDQPYYEKMVGILPFLRAKTPNAENAMVFLNLPPGTLTQRTLIYAMRIHPERPLSAEGLPEQQIVKAATEHSEYQAKTGILGHQNFGARSAKVSAALGGGGASEICAQSWADEGLFEGAIGCVRAWRNSSGHWNIAKRKHRYFGYDMVKGRNNTWFATGLFVD